MKNTLFEKYISLSAKTSVLRAMEFPEIKKELKKKFNIDFQKIQRAQTWNEIDKIYVSKINVIDIDDLKKEKPKNLRHPVSTSVAEYYYNSSCIFLIDKIKIPTLVIHAKDDPIIPFDCLPLDSCVNNSNMVVLTTNYGSHC